MKICAATGNAGKLRELRRILEAQGHESDDLLPFTPEGFVEELLPREWKH